MKLKLEQAELSIKQANQLNDKRQKEIKALTNRNNQLDLELNMLQKQILDQTPDNVAAVHKKELVELLTRSRIFEAQINKLIVEKEAL